LDAGPTVGRNDGASGRPHSVLVMRCRWARRASHWTRSSRRSPITQVPGNPQNDHHITYLGASEAVTRNGPVLDGLLRAGHVACLAPPIAGICSRPVRMIAIEPPKYLNTTRYRIPRRARWWWWWAVGTTSGTPRKSPAALVGARNSALHRRVHGARTATSQQPGRSNGCGPGAAHASPVPAI
jgi:hypothetical protein